MSQRAATKAPLAVVVNGSAADIPGNQQTTCLSPAMGGTCKLQTGAGAVFDSQTINANYGHPIQYQPPRVFRFGLRMTF